VKADRLVSVLLMLQSSRMRTARELATALEVSERTIYRDVEALCAAGVPLYTERGVDGGIALADGYKKALLHFGEEEIRALFSSGSAVMADLGLGSNLDLALDKLRGGFSEKQRGVAEKARKRIHIDQRRWNQSDPPVERLALLRRAVWDDRCVELRYEDRNKTQTSRRADPYGLVSKAGIWYLVAGTAEGFRSFRVDRIIDVVELTERFERALDFELDRYWKASSAGTGTYAEGCAVTMRVALHALDYVLTYWPYERIDPDDALLVRMTFSSEDAALYHLIAWGTDVNLLEPSRFRSVIADRARAVLAHYG
jgi:predicted DNA-binding transcriptional regulator YafY